MAVHHNRPYLVIPHDGYTWLKYGQKILSHTKLTRAYFKCGGHKSHLCPAKKLVDFDSGHPYYAPPSILYQHRHSHGPTVGSIKEEEPQNGQPNARDECSLQTPVHDGHMHNAPKPEELCYAPGSTPGTFAHTGKRTRLETHFPYSSPVTGHCDDKSNVLGNPETIACQVPKRLCSSGSLRDCWSSTNLSSTEQAHDVLALTPLPSSARGCHPASAYCNKESPSPPAFCSESSCTGMQWQQPSMLPATHQVEQHQQHQQPHHQHHNDHQHQQQHHHQHQQQNQRQDQHQLHYQQQHHLQHLHQQQQPHPAPDWNGPPTFGPCPHPFDFPDRKDSAPHSTPPFFPGLPSRSAQVPAYIHRANAEPGHNPTRSKSQEDVEQQILAGSAWPEHPAQKTWSPGSRISALQPVITQSTDYSGGSSMHAVTPSSDALHRLYESSAFSTPVPCCVAIEHSRSPSPATVQHGHDGSPQWAECVYFYE